MTDEQWVKFFTACNEVLGKGGRTRLESENWCIWTVFGRLDVGYWSCGLPVIEDLMSNHIRDSGVWSQPFLYQHIAHIIIAKEFEWEIFDKDAEPIYQRGEKIQNIEKLSERLNELQIPHNLSEHCLDIKLF